MLCVMFVRHFILEELTKLALIQWVIGIEEVSCNQVTFSVVHTVSLEMLLVCTSVIYVTSQSIRTTPYTDIVGNNVQSCAC